MLALNDTQFLISTIFRICVDSVPVFTAFPLAVIRHPEAKQLYFIWAHSLRDRHCGGVLVSKVESFYLGQETEKDEVPAIAHIHHFMYLKVPNRKWCTFLDVGLPATF